MKSSLEVKTMTDVLEASYLAAIDSMRQSGPKKLLSRARLHAEEEGFAEDEVAISRLVSRLVSDGPNGALRKQLHVALATWDADHLSDSWNASTPVRTQSRRQRIYELLQLDGPTAATFDDLFPVNEDKPILIDEKFEPWYTEERRRESNFYWTSYSDYLMDQKGWLPDSIADLNTATTRVVERLSDPYAPVARQAKGLVVGYVQSGKTANFTGVIAKAIDAGYRLIIVMTGTIDLLREQTQRRLDMELVGVENILRGIDPSDEELVASQDYQQDPDWLTGGFVHHGFLPSDHGMPDIVRRTTHRFDYRRLPAGITALDFEKRDPSKPLFDKANLPQCNAKLVVVKKNKRVLEKLVKDLKSSTARLSEVPALIIDDESDLASVNTSDPSKWKDDEVTRTAINKLLSKLLSLLPRGQYVGYTATPFANVFIDPSDAEDIFPKDFLVGLDRPPNYMGVRDFHDIDSEIEAEERTVENSQEKAYVRDLFGGDKREAEMQRALDSFVLSGAIKLYREAAGLGEGKFRHHTMLVHESVKQAEHALLAAEIRDIWKSSGYSSPSGLARLAELFYDDFVPVTAAKGNGLPMPAAFDDLRDHIGDTVGRITNTSDPVIIVNGDKDMAKEEIDFDKRGVWRVLVGGTKLSRGFTVEGLTVSYYGRKTKQADTLMQMGRWFGFRGGYEDLVRLFIGRRVVDGNKTIDLYEAFGAIVRDEEHFRDQLKKYSVMVDGKPQVTPTQIHPLVAQHLAWLRPAARNKMFNAKLATRRSPGDPVEPTAYPKDASSLRANFDRWKPIIVRANEEVRLSSGAAISTGFDAFITLVGYSELLDVLSGLTWFVGDHFAPDLAYFREIVDQVDDCFVVLPQVGDKGIHRVFPGIGMRSLFHRNRTRDPRFQGISEPKHRHAILQVAGVEPVSDLAVRAFAHERRAALLLYPLIERELAPLTSDEAVDVGEVVMAFTLVAPDESAPGRSQLIEFVARNRADES